MFHEPYVELIDSNGNNQDEVEELRRAARWPRHMVLFYLPKTQKVDLTDCTFFSLFLTW